MNIYNLMTRIGFEAKKPIFWQATALLFYSFAVGLFIDLEKSILFNLSLIVFSYGVNWLFFKIKPQQKLNPYVPLLIALGPTFIIDSTYWWVYYLTIFATHISKAFFLNSDGRHIFNPINFGVVFALVLLKPFATGIPILSAQIWWLVVLLYILGINVMLRAKTYDLTLSWAAFYILFNCIFLAKGNWMLAQFYLSYLTAPSLLIFMFHMLTDPVTAPRTRKGRIIFSFFVALIGVLFRAHNYPNGYFIALFIAYAGYNLWLRKSFWLGIGSLASVLGSIVFLPHVLSSHNFVVEGEYPPHLKKVMFKDRGLELGINFIHKDPVISGSSFYRLFFITPGVVIRDFNNDGLMDIFALTSDPLGENHLYINEGGTFVNKAKEYGIDRFPVDQSRISGSVSATAVDINQDGWDDIYISRYGCNQLFINYKTHFKEESIKYRLADCNNTQYAFAHDFNKDGLVDLYLARYQPVAFWEQGYAANAPDNEEDALDGGVDSLYLNQGDGTFRLNYDLIKSGPRWTFDSLVWDYDNDGVLDFVSITDFGPEQYYKGVGNLYEENSREITFKDKRNGMNGSVSYLPGEDNPYLFISNIFIPKIIQWGNFLWKFNEEKGKLEDFAKSRGVHNCGWGWGAVFGDFNQDGYEDFYLANGFISGKRGENTLALASFKAMGVKQREELKGLFFDRAKEIGQGSFSGFQVDCLFLYDSKSNKYVNVGKHSGITLPHDGRSVGAIDFDNDGDLDLVVSAQNNYLRFYENLSPPGHWVGFNLQGTPSEKVSMVGAKFEIYQEGFLKQTKMFFNGKSGFLTQSDPRLNFGLPSGEKILLKIRLNNKVVEKEYEKINQYIDIDISSLNLLN